MPYVCWCVCLSEWRCRQTIFFLWTLSGRCLFCCCWESMCLWIISICPKIHINLHTHTNFWPVPTPHKVRDRPHPNKSQTIRGFGRADCCSHDSGGCDSLPCSPHPSALHKDLPCGKGSEAPRPLFTPSLWHWPPTLCFDYFGKVQWLTSSQQLQVGTDLHRGPDANSRCKCKFNIFNFRFRFKQWDILLVRTLNLTHKWHKMLQ